jgi:hypothetical protein
MARPCRLRSHSALQRERFNAHLVDFDKFPSTPPAKGRLSYAMVTTASNPRFDPRPAKVASCKCSRRAVLGALEFSVHSIWIEPALAHPFLIREIHDVQHLLWSAAERNGIRRRRNDISLAVDANPLILVLRAVHIVTRIGKEPASASAMPLPVMARR